MRLPVWCTNTFCSSQYLGVSVRRMRFGGRVMCVRLCVQAGRQGCAWKRVQLQHFFGSDVHAVLCCHAVVSHAPCHSPCPSLSPLSAHVQLCVLQARCWT